MTEPEYRRYRVKIYTGLNYNENNIEKDLNELYKEGYKPMHVDTQEAYTAIVWEIIS